MVENVIFNVQIHPYFTVKVKNGFKSFRAASAARELKHAARNSEAAESGTFCCKKTTSDQAEEVR